MKKVQAILAPSLTIILLLAIWEFLLPVWGRSTIFLSKPSVILRAFVENFSILVNHAKVTFFEMAISWFLAAIISIPLGYFMYVTKWIKASLQPLFIVVQCLPMFTLAPLMLIIFGWHMISIIIPTVLMIFFPLTISVYQGMQSIPSTFHEYATLHQTPSLKKYFKLQLPFSLSHIMSGLKVSTAIAGVGAIAGEWAGAQQGLGIYMIECRRNMDFDCLFSAIFLLVFLTLLFYGAVTILEKVLLKKRYV